MPSRATQHVSTRTATATSYYARTVSGLSLVRRGQALLETFSDQTRRWCAPGAAFRRGWPGVIVPLAAVAATMVVMVAGWLLLSRRLGRDRSRRRFPTCRV